MASTAELYRMLSWRINVVRGGFLIGGEPASVRFVLADAGHAEGGVVAAVEALVDLGVAAIVGHYQSSWADTAAAACERLETIHFVPFAKDIGSAAEWTFGMAPSNTREFAAVAMFASAGATRFGLVCELTPEAEQIGSYAAECAAAVGQIEQLGLEAVRVDVGRMLGSVKDVADAARSLQGEVDVVLGFAALPVCFDFLETARDEGLDFSGVYFEGCDLAALLRYDTTLLDKMQSAARLSTWEVGWHDSLESTAHDPLSWWTVSEFVAEFEVRTSGSQVSYEVNYALATLHVLSAIERVGTVEGHSVRTALVESWFPALGSNSSFSTLDHHRQADLYVLQLGLNNEKNVVWPLQYATADLVYPLPGWAYMRCAAAAARAASNAALGGAPLCVVCTSNTFSTVVHDSGCAAAGGSCSDAAACVGWCDVGEAFNGSACVACPAGFHKDIAGVGLECSPCGRGRFGPSPGLASCEYCDRMGYADVEALTECRSCPSNTVRSSARQLVNGLGTDISDCMCASNTYTLSNATGVACEGCMAGGVCPGGAALPYPQQGWWGDPLYRHMFVECSEGWECHGGFECHRSASGRLCSEVKRGWWQIGSSRVRCPQRRTLRLVLTLFSMAVCLALWICLNRYACDAYDVFDVLLSMLQEAAIISTFNIKWPSLMSLMQRAFDVALFEVDFIQPSCVMDWRFQHSLAMQLGLPIVVAACCFSPVVLRAGVLLKKDPSLRSVLRFFELFEHYRGVLGPEASRAVRTVFIVLSLFHAIVTLKTLEVLAGGCATFPNGISYMVADPMVRCGGRVHIRIVVASALAFTLYALGWPISLACFFARSRAKGVGLHRPRELERFGAFYARYLKHVWYDVTFYARAIALIALSTCVGNGATQAALAALTISLSGTYSFVAWPFKDSMLNWLVALCHFANLCFALAAMLIEAGVPRRGEAFMTACAALGAAVGFGVVAQRWEFDSLAHAHEAQLRTTRECDARRGQSIHIKRPSLLKRLSVPRLLAGSSSPHPQTTNSDLTEIGEPSSASRGRAPEEEGGTGPALVRWLEGTLGAALPSSLLFSGNGNGDEDELWYRAALEEFANTIDGRAWRVWARDARRTPDDFETCACAAEVVRGFVADDAPTSSFSWDARADFWRRLVEACPHIFHFAIDELENEETRHQFFASLVRLQRYERTASRAKYRRIAKGDRSSLLYFACAATDIELKPLRTFLRQIDEAWSLHAPAPSPDHDELDRLGDLCLHEDCPAPVGALRHPPADLEDGLRCAAREELRPSLVAVSAAIANFNLLEEAALRRAATGSIEAAEPPTSLAKRGRPPRAQHHLRSSLPHPELIRRPPTAAAIQMMLELGKIEDLFCGCRPQEQLEGR